MGAKNSLLEPEKYRELALFASRWPCKKWSEVKKELRDPNNLFSKIHGVFGINRGKDYFECERRKYLDIEFSRDSYFRKMEEYLNKLELSENLEDTYNSLDYLRNYGLHFLLAWNKHATTDISLLGNLDEYRNTKNAVFEICSELYKCVSIENYSPNIKEISKNLERLKDACEVLPEKCRSKIRQLDNPAAELIHGYRVNFVSGEYDTVIGVLDSGIELPFIIGFIQNEIKNKNPEIAYLKYSGYSEGAHIKNTKIDRESSVLEIYELKEKIKDKKVLIFDDSMYTGKTLRKIVNFLKETERTNVDATSVEFIEFKNMDKRIADLWKYIDEIVPPTFLRETWKSEIAKMIGK
mgnify:CR=1 FL=1